MLNSSIVETEKPLAYRVRPFCKRAGISPATLYKYIGLGKIRVVKFGGRTLISAAEADRIFTEGVK